MTVLPTKKNLISQKSTIYSSILKIWLHPKPQGNNTNLMWHHLQLSSLIYNIDDYTLIIIIIIEINSYKTLFLTLNGLVHPN